jgi:hypothetical protein
MLTQNTSQKDPLTIMKSGMLQTLSMRHLTFKNAESRSLFLNKVEELSNHILYVSAGAFAVLPLAFNNLRKPYIYQSLVLVLIAAGIPATIMAAVLKIMSNGFQRRAAFVASDSNIVSPVFWILLQFGGLLLIIQVGAFISFIAFNVQSSLHRPPQIDALKIEQSIVEPGTVVPISISAQDPDADRLMYRWRADGGVVVDTDTPYTTWVAPSIDTPQQLFHVAAVVSDGWREDTRFASILVRQSPTQQARIEKLCLMAKPLTLSTGTEEKSTCEQITEYIYRGATPQEQEVRAELLESQMEKQSEAQSNGKRKKWLGCCSTALVPLLCDPRC